MDGQAAFLNVTYGALALRPPNGWPGNSSQGHVRCPGIETSQWMARQQL